MFVYFGQAMHRQDLFFIFFKKGSETWKKQTQWHKKPIEEQGTGYKA